MVNKTVKRNKLAARSVVILGTILASSAIWISVSSSVKPASNSALRSPNIPTTQTLSSTNNNVPSTVQTPKPTQTVVPSQTTVQQRVIPRLSTRGS